MIKLTRREAIAAILNAVVSTTIGVKVMSADTTQLEKMPSLFLGHGSPMNAIQDNDFTQSLQRLGNSLPRPKAVLMVSAHWETEGSWVTGMDRPRTIHDFYGFPEALYDVQYAAPGSPDIVKEVTKTIINPHIGVDVQETNTLS